MKRTTTILAGTLLATLALAACTPAESPASKQANVAAKDAPKPAAAPTPELAPAAEPGTATPMSQILDMANIGRRLDIFERVAGAPDDATADSSSYVIEGCPVSVATKDGAVTWIDVMLVAECGADISMLFKATTPMPGNGGWTFGDFEKAVGPSRFKGPCLGNCGNAFEPYFEAVAGGAHVDNFIEIVAWSTSYAAYDELKPWLEHVEQATSTEFVEEAGWNCDNRFNDAALQAVAGVKIEQMGFGLRDVRYNCDSRPPAP